MFKKLFNGYRNKSREAGRIRWIITSVIQAKAKHFAGILQSKSQRIPVTQMKWYLACFFAVGLTSSLLSVLTSGSGNQRTVTIKQMASVHPEKVSMTSHTTNDLRNFRQALRMEQFLDSLIQNARSKEEADSLLLRHRGLQDSIQLLKSLYRQE